MATDSFFKDIPLSFIPNPVSGDVRPVTNERAVKLALMNLLRTPIGTRRFYPQYGTDITDYMFQPADEITESEINESIADAIKRFEPRVKVVSIESSIEDYGVDITISYYVINVPGIQTLETTITRAK